MAKKASELKGYDSIFATRLRGLMAINDFHKITQEELAKKVGCSRQAISQYMDGTSVPSADKLLSISYALNVSTDYLLGLTEVPTKNTKVREICEYIGLNESVVCTLNSVYTEDGANNATLQFLNFLFNEDAVLNFYRLSEIFAGYKKLKKQLNTVIEENSKIPIYNSEEAAQIYNSIEEAKDTLEINEFKVQKIIIELLNKYCTDEMKKSSSLEQYERIMEVARIISETDRTNRVNCSDDKDFADFDENTLVEKEATECKKLLNEILKGKNFEVNDVNNTEEK